MSSSKEYFVTKLLEWYQQNGREFPWREKSRSPYEILVGEVMLQKTRAENVVECYNEFVENYPSPEELVEAGESEIKSIVKPLGLYRRRAKTLKEIGVFFTSNDPSRGKNEIENIHGVGKYIKNAFLSIAHGEPRPIVDVNVKRVISRFFSLEVKDDPRRDPELWEFARELVPEKKCRSFNLAIVDFGALVCKKSNPSCKTCPLGEKCAFDK